jgi:hypothetical protein
MFLVGMALIQGAFGDNAAMLNTALYNHGNRYITQLQWDAMNHSRFSELTRTAVQNFQQDSSLPSTGIVDVRTWRALGLPVNSTLSQEFWSGRRGNSRTAVSISGSNVNIHYHPRVYIREQFFAEYTCYDPVEDMDVIRRVSYYRAVGDGLYNQLMAMIRQGVGYWAGSHNIYGLWTAVSVDFQPVKAASAIGANIIVTTNSDFYSSVPGSLIWDTWLTATMYLNIGDERYWNNLGNPTSRVANIAAHEFGHVLGIFDAYGYVPNPIEARDSRALSDGVMRSVLQYDPIVRDTEIKMMLYAWKTGIMQTYEQTWFPGVESVVFYQSGARYS